jgi:hypothetical protein
MIKHIVMWRIQDNKEDTILEIKRQLDELPEKINEIKTFEVGINFNPSIKSFDVALYSEFNSDQDLEAYQLHPAHQKVKDYIVSVVSDSAVVDYKV